MLQWFARAPRRVNGSNLGYLGRYPGTYGRHHAWHPNHHYYHSTTAAAVMTMTVTILVVLWLVSIEEKQIVWKSTLRGQSIVGKGN